MDQGSHISKVLGEGLLKWGFFFFAFVTVFFFVISRALLLLGIVAHLNSTTRETEARESEDPCQYCLHNETLS